MATRITYRQCYIAPDGTLEIPHAEQGSVQILEAAYAGGGGDQRYLLHLAIIEPVSDGDASRSGPKPA